VLANLGRLSDALNCCERWIAADKTSASAHYLRAVILQEQGSLQEARVSLRRALYLEPRFVLAHFALANVARALEKGEEVRKHLANALDLLRDQEPDDVVPESEGLTAGRLAETIASMTQEGVWR
jgi:chemotaxis protein methyltransferase CheR